MPDDAPLTPATLNTLNELTAPADVAERIARSPQFAARCWLLLDTFKEYATVIEAAVKARIEAEGALMLPGGDQLVLAVTERRTVANTEALIAALRTLHPDVAARVVVTKETTTLGAVEKALKDRAPTFLAGLPDGTIETGTSRSLKQVSR